LRHRSFDDAPADRRGRPEDVRAAAAGLAEEDAVVDVAGTDEDAVWMATATPYDAIVLDVMLPGIDGLEACRRMRSEGVWAPVLLLTARDAVEDRVAGFAGGADDYLTKPKDSLGRFRHRGPVEVPAVVIVREGSTARLPPTFRKTRRPTRC